MPDTHPDTHPDTTLAIDTSHPVLVTGATGYVAGWLIHRLLEQGVTVHAAVRDPDNRDKRSHLDRMAERSSGSIVYYRADLMEEDSFDTAMRGCAIVFHTASPFLVDFDDPQRDLVDPALKGTENVLNSVERTASVQRVVLTSSVAAIFSDIGDVKNAPNGILSEAVWNETSTLEDKPYSLSKALAEKAAWAMADAQQRWRLVVINPALVLGPGTAARQTSASFDYVRMLIDGTFKDGAPEFQVGMVDVRDVAEAHLRAAYVAGANGRHITYSETLSLNEIAQHVRTTMPGLPLPAPKDYDGEPWRADNSRSTRELGLEYRHPLDGVMDMVRQLIEDGQVSNPPA